jgi:hypothetical protein
MYDFYGREFWRFVFVQQGVAKLGGDSDRVPTDAGIRELQSAAREKAPDGVSGNQQRYRCRRPRPNAMASVPGPGGRILPASEAANREIALKKPLFSATANSAVTSMPLADAND